MQNSIILSLGRDSWLATFTGPHTANIVELFGVDTIPLPYTEQADADYVRSEIQASNPDVFVRFA